MEIEKFEIFYIRHANTLPGESEGRDSCDIALSPLGEKELVLLEKRFSGMKFDGIITSPLVRCVRTAYAVARAADCEKITLMSALVEKGSSAGYRGQSADYLSRYCPGITFDEIRVSEEYSSSFEGEDDLRCRRRAKEAIERLTGLYDFGKRIVAVSHGSFGNAFIPQAVGMPEGDYILSLANTGVSKIKFTADGKKRISFLNDISHLREIRAEYEYDA